MEDDDPREVAALIHIANRFTREYESQGPIGVDTLTTAFWAIKSSKFDLWYEFMTQIAVTDVADGVLTVVVVFDFGS